MSTAHFSVTYIGQALDNHEMDARDLAGALLAVGDLAGDAASVLYGEGVKTSVKVRATRPGSFGIDLALHQSILHSIVALLDGHAAEAMANASGIIAQIVGVITFTKWIRNRRIRSIEKRSDNLLVVFIEDGDNQEFDERVIKLYQDLKTRNSLSKVLSPVSKSGIDGVTFGDDSSRGVGINKQELGYFDVPIQPDDLLLDETRTMALSIVSLAFKEENKWRLSDGSSTIYAIIADSGFLKKVDENLISFSKGDVLMCRVRVTQWQDVSGVKTEYIVEEILEHRPGRRQLKIPFASPN
jgi:hypothetical protein